MVMERAFTFQGPDPKTPRLALLGIETNVSLEPTDGASASAKPDESIGVAGKIGAHEGRGTLTFDMEAGRIVSSRMKQKIDMQITGPTQQKLEQSTETTSTMTLEP